MLTQVLVNEGRVLVDSVRVAHESEHAIVVSADLRTKYAAVCGLGHADDGFTVILGWDECTLHLGDGDDYTKIRIRCDRANKRIVLADVGRYTVYIVIVPKPGDDAREVWASERRT